MSKKSTILSEGPSLAQVLAHKIKRVYRPIETVSREPRKLSKEKEELLNQGVNIASSVLINALEACDIDNLSAEVEVPLGDFEISIKRLSPPKDGPKQSDKSGAPKSSYN
jgi:hypothetical protein